MHIQMSQIRRSLIWYFVFTSKIENSIKYQLFLDFKMDFCFSFPLVCVSSHDLFISFPLIYLTVLIQIILQNIKPILEMHSLLDSLNDPVDRENVL